MSESLPTVYLACHGEAAWSLTGQHTGLTDLPLNERGQRTAGQLGERLKGLGFAKVLTSPFQRARHTCELAGFAAVAGVDPTWLNAITVNIRAAAPVTSVRGVRTGNCSATVAQAANHRKRSQLVLIAR